MTDTLDESDEFKAKVRKALSPVLGGKAYVIVVDASTLDDLKDGTSRIHIIAPEYQMGILTRGLIETAKQIQYSDWEDDD